MIDSTDLVSVLKNTPFAEIAHLPPSIFSIRSLTATLADFLLAFSTSSFFLQDPFVFKIV
jgi:hypothetical protein